MSTTVWIVWKPRQVMLEDSDAKAGVSARVDVVIDTNVIDSIHVTESSARAVEASHRDWWVQEWEVTP